ncbi:hypothetical protein C8R46DRAFT_1196741 [Mycena filopes]|nr:hypothetical protein C8R46DRAFT_1196741 [Mycena filopes]
MYIPPELIEAILHAVDLDMESLKACSLVGPAFQRPSQRILLWSLTLDPLARTTSYLAAATLLAESPHVATYIKRLAITLPLEVLTSLDVESLIQIFDRLRDVQTCVLDGAYHASTFDWSGLPPRLQTEFTDFLLRQSLAELHLISLSNMPPSMLFRLLRSAKAIFLFWVRIQSFVAYSTIPVAVGLDRYPMARLGLMSGCHQVSEFLGDPDAEFEAPNLRHLDILADQFAYLSANTLISSTSQTLEHLNLICLGSMNARHSVLEPLPSFPALTCAEITLNINVGPETWFISMLSTLLAPETAPVLAQLIITYTRIPSAIRLPLPDSTLNAIDDDLIAHPAAPSLKWRVDLSDHHGDINMVAFMQAVEFGMPKVYAKERVVVEEYRQPRPSLPYIVTS